MVGAPAVEHACNFRLFRKVVGETGGRKDSAPSVLIVTGVLPRGQATGFHLVEPPHAERATFYPFVGRISGNELVVRKTDVEIVGALGSDNALSVSEAWGNADPVARVLLKPVWTLADAERTTKQ